MDETISDDPSLIANMAEGAREVIALQKILLPPRLPNFPGWEMAVHYRASSIAGGDFYAFEDVGPDQTGIIVADVCGHGARAMVVMAMLRAWLGSFRVFRRPLKQLASDLNALLLEVEGLNVFVTAFFMALELREGTFLYLGCGHPPPRLRRVRGTVERLDQARGLPLGIGPDYQVDSPGVGRLAAGETLVFFTDGITEASNDTRGFFDDDDRLDRAIAAGGTAAEVCGRIVEAVRDFRGGQPQADDECVLVVRRLSDTLAL